MITPPAHWGPASFPSQSLPSLPILLDEKTEPSGELCAWSQNRLVVEKGPNPSAVHL